jgi:hypothetical protein
LGAVPGLVQLAVNNHSSPVAGGVSGEVFWKTSNRVFRLAYSIPISSPPPNVVLRGPLFKVVRDDPIVGYVQNLKIGTHHRFSLSYETE